MRENITMRHAASDQRLHSLAHWQNDNRRWEAGKTLATFVTVLRLIEIPNAITLLASSCRDKFRNQINKRYTPPITIKYKSENSTKIYFHKISIFPQRHNISSIFLQTETPVIISNGKILNDYSERISPQSHEYFKSLIAAIIQTFN